MSERYLLLELLPPALDLQAPWEAGQQLAGDGASVAPEHDGGLVGVPAARLHVHEDELDAGRPLWRLPKVQLPVEPAGVRRDAAPAVQISPISQEAWKCSISSYAYI